MTTIHRRNRHLLQQKKIRNWRIVAGVLLLLVVYSILGKMDREAYAAQHRPLMQQQHKVAGGVA